jgi:shikimate kinase
MPLSGKTYWAKRLSVELNMPYIDIDAEIERSYNNTVRHIFQTEGEAVFRKYEHEMLLEIVSKSYSETTIISCGGGLPIYYDNLAVIKNEGCVVYLKAGIELLTERFERIEDRNDRPLLADVPEIEKQLEAILKERKNIYEKADYILDVDMATVSTFEEIIKSCIKDH